VALHQALHHSLDELRPSAVMEMESRGHPASQVEKTK
jgi:hypothetical protein